jgi:hypothetical protein
MAGLFFPYETYGYVKYTEQYKCNTHQEFNGSLVICYIAFVLLTFSSFSHTPFQSDMQPNKDIKADI